MKLVLSDITLEGDLTLPKDAVGIVIFAHGSGSSRLSPRNKMVADELNKNGHATLLFDLLTQEEDKDPEARFDIELLSERLIEVVEYIRKEEKTKGLKIGLFGSSTGAAAALIAASKLKQKVSAVVSRGGRPDLAARALASVIAPTLIIVGGNDSACIPLNEMAFRELSCEKKLALIEGASHLFEEGSSLVQVASLAIKWFSKHF